MVLSTGVPSLADKRYFLSQMSSDASWKGIASTSLCSSLTTLFMDGYLSPEVLGLFFKTPKPEPEKRKRRPHACSSCRSTRLYVCGRCQTTAIPAPRLPSHQDVSRHNILCWGRKPKYVKTARQETSLS